VRIDVVTIFPDYLAPLGLSLPGKAQDRGLLELAVHDLRDWARDRHRTVDDTPYGGGAGMVMKPEPWGEALDAVAGRAGSGPTIVFTTPGGQPFTQEVARELAEHDHLVFACGRYEGIDQRVVEHAATLGEVRELSLGDYVLNGGEVAALAITEAVVRLLPGFMGNAESLSEESHEDGLLEYPVYTKPASWRGRDVPDVLLGGNHGAIAAWRHRQRLHRTAARRPDLLAPAAVGDLEVRVATAGDAGELLTLQRACGVPDQQAGADPSARQETVEDVRRWLGERTVLVGHRAGRLVAAVRARLEGPVWEVDRLVVAPDLQGEGLADAMLSAVEAAAPPEVTSYALVTDAGDDVRRHRRAGYRLRGDSPGEPGAVRLTKRRTISS